MKLSTKIALLAASTALMPLSAMAQTPPGLAGLDSATQAQMQQLITGAEKEGSLTYWDSSIQPDTNAELVSAFKAYYGLPASFTVNYNYAGSLALITRVEQELQADNVTIDVAAVGNPIWAFGKAKDGQLMQYDAPEYAHYSQVFKLGLGDPGYFAFDGAYVFTPVWNANALNFKGTSWYDLVGSVPDGRIGYSDASQSATQLVSYYAMRQVLPESFFKSIAAMRPFFSNRSQQVTDRLITAQDLITLAGQPNRAEQYNQKGANLKVVYPKEGVPLIPQDTVILKAAPHPDAAKLWVNFILSEQGQEILVKHEGLISGRDGFVSPDPEYSPALDTVKVIPVDWKDVTDTDLKRIEKEWVRIFKH